MSINFTKKPKRTLRLLALLIAGLAGVGLAMTAPSSFAQNHQSMPGMDMGSPSAAPPKAKPRAPQAKKPTPKPAPQKQPPAKRPSDAKGETSMPAMDHSQMKGMDNQSMPQMDHSSPTSKDKAMDPNMPGMTPAAKKAPDQSPVKGQSDSMSNMDTSAMQGGSAPPDARDADAYADGLVSGPMPGMDMADHEPYGMLLLDKFEYVEKENALRLDGEAFYGGDYKSCG